MPDSRDLIQQVAQEIEASRTTSQTPPGPTRGGNRGDADSRIEAINQVFALFRLNYHNQYYAAFPDARFVMTHRDPTDVMVSVVDVFSEVSTEQLSHLAVVAEELALDAGSVIYTENDPSDAMYLVLTGSVRIHRKDLEVTVATANTAFGTWALFDDEPRLTSATVQEDAQLLVVGGALEEPVAGVVERGSHGGILAPRAGRASGPPRTGSPRAGTAA